MRTKAWSRWIGAALLGGAAAVWFFFAYLNALMVSQAQQVFSLAYLFAFFTLVIFFLMGLSAQRLAAAGYTLKHRLVWWSLAFLAGVMLYFTIPVSPPNVTDEIQKLEIIASGEHDSLAKGTEVWLQSIQLPDGKNLDLKDLKQEGDWVFEGEALAATGAKPARLRWQGEQTGEYKLVFGMHPWSGKVAILWNGAEQIYDLYSDPGSIQQISLLSPTNTPLAYKITFGLSACLSFGVLLFLFSAFFITFSLKHPVRPRPVARWWWLVYTLPIIVLELLYLLSFWPGIMSSDSHDQWIQMMKFSLNDHHPAFHTLFIWLVTRLWFSPAMVATVQILVFSLLTAWALILFQRRGVPAWLNLAALGLILVTPVPHFLNITLWKDTTYALAFLWMVILIYLVVDSAGEWVKKWSHVILLAIAAALVGLFRHNGWPVSFATLLVLGLCIPRNRWRMLESLGLAIVLVFGMKQIEYRLLNVAPPSSMLTYSAPLHLIGAHLKAGTQLSPQESALLNKIRSTGDSWSYNCFTVDSIVFSEKFNPGMIEVTGGWIWKEAFALTFRNPKASLEHILCSGSMGWRVIEMAGANTTSVALLRNGSRLEYVYPYLDDYIPALRQDPQLPGLQHWLADLIEQPGENSLLKMIWRPAIYLYLGLFGILLFAVRQRDWRWLLLIVPVLFQVGVYIFFPIAQNFRYLYPVALFIYIFWALLYAPRVFINTHKEEKVLK